jgi:hypothetical protein
MEVNMRQYTIGVTTGLLLALTVVLSLGSASDALNPGQYQVDTVLLAQEDYVGNKRYEVLVTVFDTRTGEIKQKRREPHINYIVSKYKKQKKSSAFDYK